MNSLEVAKKWKEAQHAKSELKTELYESKVSLQTELNSLISKTPTSEERNNYTNINIMVLDIFEKINILDSLK